MSERKAMEFWIDLERDPDDKYEDNYAGWALFNHPKQGPLQWQASLIHVREVLPDDELEKLRTENEQLRAASKVLRNALDNLRNDYSFGNGAVYDDIDKALAKFDEMMGGEELK